MSDTEKNALKVKLDWLQCHFTWTPQTETIDWDDMKQRLEDSIQAGVKYQARSYNHLAFINCLQGNCEEAIQNLKEAKRILRERHGDGFEKRILVTYGNYVWVYYHMDQLEEAQSYLDKLETVCKLFPEASRFTAMIPELYGEKGWSLLTTAAQYYEEAKKCFTKALEKDPDNIEWNVGYATALYRLEGFSGTPGGHKSTESIKQFRRVLELDPDHAEAMVLLALKLQEFNQEEEASTLVERALQRSRHHPYVRRYAAKFYRKASKIDKSLKLLRESLANTPNSAFLYHQIGLCYKSQLLHMIKASNRNNPHNSTNGKKMDLINQCKYYFKKAVKLRQSFINPQLDLAVIYSINEELQEAEKIYSDLLELEDIRPENKQAIRLQVGLFELNVKKSKPNAIIHFEEVMQVNYDSLEKERCRKILERIAKH
ncbi:interferon-induced protein with tetratricopeptide repeats 1-like isoform X2 [Chiloscyllium plagiosum]|uniref:interferon-induced protein with tetratricopeptide repeats 1-like isoform X2 n=1 Tax=Chiloscyllium plagiosum TaxID=36176 RepID=UPI001CB8224C|nr:interferon-induced protein with tetratricopeptide repeats 1-like isoform X2 [Chiloscyllium plagiosum]